jgi:uncharacterized protein (TIGR02246 family)
MQKDGKFPAAGVSPWLKAIVILGLFGVASNTTVSPRAGAAAMNQQDEEKAAVIAVAQKFVEAWNRHDMDALASVFSQDADFVNVIGQRWIGRNAIRAAHAANHATIFRASRLRMQDISVRFLKPDVAVMRLVTKLSGQLDESGHTLPPRYSMPTFVLIKVQGEWLIVVAQNTDIDTTITPLKD